MASISSPGLGSGLDVNSIVSKLMAVEKQPLQLMQQKEAKLQGEVSAFGSLKSGISAFQTAIQGLNSASSFQTLSASVSDPTVFTATANSQASPGNYSVLVSQLASSQSVSSSAFAATTTAIGTGSLSFQFGTYDSGSNSFTINAAKATQTVTISASNNTLAGIRDAVNAAKIGVNASIVNDGTGNRLVFSSNDTGAANGLKITTTDDDGINTDTSGLSQLAFDPTAAVGSGKNLSQNQAAQDAKLTINGLAIQKSSNTITDAVQGVTLNLLKASATTPVSLSVARDTGSITSAVQGLVNAYNALNKTISTLTSYNADTKQAGLLLGDSSTLSIQSALRRTLTTALGTASGGLSNLTQIGVSFQSDGTLALDSSKLSSAINNNFNDLAGLFAAYGSATDSLIQFTSSTDSTKPGQYALNISQLATQGSATGSGATGLTITSGVNDQLSLTVDGVSASITLAAGTYSSASALAAQMQSQVNGATTLTSNGSAISVSQSGGILTLTSNRYGSASSVGVTGGTAVATLFGAGATSTAGVDVAGSINGVAATGSGQTLTGASGTAVDGLKLQVLGGSLGARGTVTTTQGYAYRLNQLATNFLATNGPLDSSTSGLNALIKLNQQQQDEFNQRMVTVEQHYRAQFTALDTLISSMNQTSTYLTQQLANLPKIGS